MFGFFAWFREQIKLAFIGGVNDAIEELDEQHGPENGEPIAALKRRMSALPAPSSNGEAKKGRQKAS